MLIKMHHSVNWSRHVVIKLFISSSFLKKVGAASQMRARVYTELHWRPVTRRPQAGAQLRYVGQFLRKDVACC